MVAVYVIYVPYFICSLLQIYIFFHFYSSFVLIMLAFSLFMKSERSTVSHSHAESLLVRGKPEEAARIYALSNAEFDMVVLRLLSVLSPPPLCSSLNEPDSGAASELLYGNLRESSPSTHTDTDSNPQSHSAHPIHDDAVSAALLQYLTDKLEQLFPSPTPTPSSQVTHRLTYTSIPTCLFFCLSMSFYPSNNIFTRKVFTLSR